MSLDNSNPARMRLRVGTLAAATPNDEAYLWLM
jgi:hypothetical protein